MSPTKKPWEYEEIQIEKGAGRDFEGDLWLYAAEDAPIGVVTQEAPGSVYAWAKMFQASPKMVRALLAVVERAHSGDLNPPLETIYEALEAAGAGELLP